MKMQVPEKHKADCDVHEQRLHEEARKGHPLKTWARLEYLLLITFEPQF